jgi:hypothetical protein
MSLIENLGSRKLKGKKLDKDIDFLSLSTDDSKGLLKSN